jgi:hypothetical protein
MANINAQTIFELRSKGILERLNGVPRGERQQFIADFVNFFSQTDVQLEIAAKELYTLAQAEKTRLADDRAQLEAAKYKKENFFMSLLDTVFKDGRAIDDEARRRVYVVADQIAKKEGVGSPEQVLATFRAIKKEMYDREYVIDKNGTISKGNFIGPGYQPPSAPVTELSHGVDQSLGIFPYGFELSSRWLLDHGLHGTLQYLNHPDEKSRINFRSAFINYFNKSDVDIKLLSEDMFKQYKEKVEARIQEETDKAVSAYRSEMAKVPVKNADGTPVLNADGTPKMKDWEPVEIGAAPTPLDRNAVPGPEQVDTSTILGQAKDLWNHLGYAGRVLKVDAKNALNDIRYMGRQLYSNTDWVFSHKNLGDVIGNEVLKPFSDEEREGFRAFLRDNLNPAPKALLKEYLDVDLDNKSWVEMRHQAEAQVRVEAAKRLKEQGINIESPADIEKVLFSMRNQLFDNRYEMAKGGTFRVAGKLEKTDVDGAELAANIATLKKRLTDEERALPAALQSATREGSSKLTIRDRIQKGMEDSGMAGLAASFGFTPDNPGSYKERTVRDTIRGIILEGDPRKPEVLARANTPRAKLRGETMQIVTPDNQRFNLNDPRLQAYGMANYPEFLKSTLSTDAYVAALKKPAEDLRIRIANLEQQVPNAPNAAPPPPRGPNEVGVQVASRAPVGVGVEPSSAPRQPQRANVSSEQFGVLQAMSNETYLKKNWLDDGSLWKLTHAMKSDEAFKKYQAEVAAGTREALFDKTRLIRVQQAANRAGLRYVKDEQGNITVTTNGTGQEFSTEGAYGKQMQALFGKVFEETTALQEKAIDTAKKKGLTPAVAQPDGLYGKQTKKLLTDAEIDLAKKAPSQQAGVPTLTAQR